MTAYNPPGIEKRLEKLERLMVETAEYLSEMWGYSKKNIKGEFIERIDNALDHWDNGFAFSEE